jgi:hypothetical protein
MNRKLQEIGSKLNVSEEDINNIKKERIKGKFLYPLLGAVIACLSTVAGFFMGKANPICINLEGYPFAISGLTLAAAGVSKKRRFFLVTVIATILLSVIGFIAAYKTAQRMFGYAIKYNVYRRN